MSKKRNKDSGFINGSAAQKLDIVSDTEINQQKFNHNPSETVLEDSMQSSNNIKPSQTFNNKNFYVSEVSIWENMKVIFNRLNPKSGLPPENTNSLLKKTALSSLGYGVSFISYVAMIYFISYSLSDSKENFETSWRENLYAFIISIIILSSLIYLFRLLIWHYQYKKEK